MSETNNAASEFWASNPAGGKKSFLSGDAKKSLADSGTPFIILRVAERRFNDRKTGMPVPQWALSVQLHPGEPVYTLTMGKTDGRDEFMTALRDYIENDGPILASLDYIQPEKGNPFYVILDPDSHPANAQQTLDLDTGK